MPLSLNQLSAYDYIIQLKIPEGHYGRIAPHSGLVIKNFIDMGAVVIDRDYIRNEGVVLFDFGHNHFYKSRGDIELDLCLKK